MLNNTPITDDATFWMEMRKKSCDRNTSFQKRIIAGTHEKTHQSEDGSSAFLWINMEPGVFPLHWHSTVEIIMPVQNSFTVTVKWRPSLTSCILILSEAKAEITVSRFLYMYFFVRFT